jgi:hypothetical protein
MRNLFGILSLVTLLGIVGCSDDDGYNVIQVGKWQGIGVVKSFLTDTLRSIDTSYFELSLDKDKTGSKTTQGQENVQKYIDWNIENDRIIMTVEATRPWDETETYEYYIGFDISFSQDDKQIWRSEYDVKPEMSDVVYHVINTWYLTRIE